MQPRSNRATRAVRRDGSTHPHGGLPSQHAARANVGPRRTRRPRPPTLRPSPPTWRSTRTPGSTLLAGFRAAWYRLKNRASSLVTIHNVAENLTTAGVCTYLLRGTSDSRNRVECGQAARIRCDAPAPSPILRRGKTPPLPTITRGQTADQQQHNNDKQDQSACSTPYRLPLLFSPARS